MIGFGSGGAGAVISAWLSPRLKSGLPPEPIRYPGAHVVKAAVARKERAEDTGRRVDPLTRRIVGFAPAGLVPVKKGTKES